MTVFLVEGEFGSSPFGNEPFGGTGYANLELSNRITFLIHNEIEEKDTATITADSTAAGFLSNIKKVNAGAGNMAINGSYSGSATITVVVKIIDAGTDGSVGQAKYHFSLDGGTTWYTNAGIGYTTSLSTNDTPVELYSLGILLSFSNTVVQAIAGFVVGDHFSFVAYQNYHPENLLDWDRSIKHRGASNTLVYDIDFGMSTAQVNAFALHGHNLTPGLDSIHIKATNNLPGANQFDSPEVDETINFATKHACYIWQTIPQQYKYWRITLDSSNSGVHPEAEHLFLGLATQLSKDINRQFGFEYKRFSSETEFRTGSSYRTVHGLRRYFTGNFSNLKDTDRNKIVDLWRTVNTVAKQERAFYVVNLITTPNDYLYSVFNQQKINIDYVLRNRHAWAMNLKEAS